VTERRVVLHAGLHKTGTTSLQAALGHSEVCVYPEAQDPGPGHARAIWRAIGIYGEQRDPRLLVELVERHDGDRAGLPLVISAEDCVHAIFRPHGAEAFRSLAESVPTELVVTVRSDDRRLASVAQELIKHGAHVDFSRYWECALQSELMADNLLLGLFSLAPWQHLHVIHSDEHDHLAVFAAFSKLLGGVVHPVPAQNVRWPAAKLRILNHLNGTLDVAHERRLALLESLWRYSEAGFQARVEDDYPVIPQVVLTRLNARFRRELEELARTAGSKLTMYGSPE
jgi:hypothetical protein